MKLSVRESPKRPGRYAVRADGKVVFRGSHAETVVFLEAWLALEKERRAPPDADPAAQQPDMFPR